MRWLYGSAGLVGLAAAASTCKYSIELVQLQDASDSFQDDLQRMQKVSPDLVRALQASYPGSKAGLAAFIDKPIPARGYGPYGGYQNGYVQDFCYMLATPLSDDPLKFQDAVSKFQLGSGFDFQENQWEGMIRAALDTAVGLSDVGAKTEDGSEILRIMLLVTDASPHSVGDASTSTTYYWNYPRSYHGEFSTGGFGSDMFPNGEAQIIIDMTSYREAVDLIKKRDQGQTWTTDESARFDELMKLVGPEKYAAPIDFPGDDSLSCELTEYPSLEQAKDVLKAKGIIPIVLIGQTAYMDDSLANTCYENPKYPDDDPIGCLKMMYEDYLAEMGLGGVVEILTKDENSLVQDIMNMIDKVASDQCDNPEPTTPAPTTTAASTTPFVCNYHLEMVHLQDASDSFKDDLDNMKSLAPDLFSTLEELYPGMHLGLAAFVDKPLPTRGYGPYGGWQSQGIRYDYCYSPLVPMTDNVTEYMDAIASMKVGSGFDFQENQLEAMLRCALDKSNGYTDGAIQYDAEGRPIARIMIMITDATPHHPGDAAGCTTYFWNWERDYSTGQSTGGFGADVFAANSQKAIIDTASYAEFTQYFRKYDSGLALTDEEIARVNELNDLVGPYPWPNIITPHPGDDSISCEFVEYPTAEQVGAVLKAKNITPVILLASIGDQDSMYKECAADPSLPQNDGQACMEQIYKNYLAQMGVEGVIGSLTQGSSNIVQAIVDAIGQVVQMKCIGH